jgi:hypothetical protein
MLPQVTDKFYYTLYRVHLAMSPGQIQPKTIEFAFAAFLVSTQHEEVRAWLAQNKDNVRHVYLQTVDSVSLD